MKAMKLALEALECALSDEPYFVKAGLATITLRQAIELTEEQAPVALFDWLPKGATHTGRICVRVCSGGALEMRTHAFKYDNGVLKVYVTDNDNEYPGWRDAKDVFFHLNFPVLPLYTAPPPRQPLTDEEIIDVAVATKSADPGRDGYILPFTFARAIEAAHGIKGEA